MIKTDVNGLYKDEASGAVLNKDRSALTAYKQKKKQIQEFNTLKARVDELENRVRWLESSLLTR